jgi:chemotaxis protein methyltransferase CheR
VTLPHRERLGENIALLLRDLIHERTGLFFDNGRSDLLEDKLDVLADERGLTSYLDYYYLLKDDAAGVEWAALVDALSVRETYFWREIEQVRGVVNELVPRWVARLNGAPLRIWSVPCSTGEEPLTIAMVLDEAGWFGRAPIELYASDASPEVLAHARRGVYRDRAFRSLPDAVRERYFSREASGWRVSASLQSRITWSRVNLVARPEAERLAACPIVFCRNLFIYFSPASIRAVVDLFASRMPPGGALCLGVSESILRVTEAFELQELGGAFVYVKP